MAPIGGAPKTSALVQQSRHQEQAPRDSTHTRGRGLGEAASVS